MTDSDKTSQPRLEKKSLSIDAFDELRSIAFATQKADKVVTLEDMRTCPICQIKFDPTRAQPEALREAPLADPKPRRGRPRCLPTHQICCTPACSNVWRVRLCRARKRCRGGGDA